MVSEQRSRQLPVQPGDAVDRYTLRVLIAHTGRSEVDAVELWQAYDPVLDRPVALRIMSAQNLRASRVNTAAQAAAVVDERHLVPVLDVLEQVPVARDQLPAENYSVIVHEWSSGATLDEVFAQREGEPLPVADALNLARQVAVAMSAAHGAGVRHRRIRPGSLLITGSTAPDGDGEVRLRGLAVDAALWEPTKTSPGVDPDVHGIGCLLYAAVTGRWPGGTLDGLPEAPTHGGAVIPPSQVRAEIPTWVDRICARAIDPMVWGAAGSHAKQSPSLAFSDVDALLAALGAPVEHAEPARRLALSTPRAQVDHTTTTPRRSPRVALRRTLGTTAAIVLIVGLGAAGWQVLANAPSPWGSEVNRAPSEVLTYVAEAEPSSITDYSSGVLPGQIVPIGIVSFDPFGSDEVENPEGVQAIIDANPVTTWFTETYFAPDLGDKPGVGVVLDLGSARAVSAVRLQLQGVGTSVQVKVGSDSQALPEDWALLAQANAIGDVIDLRSPRPVVGRYVLVWLTGLPPLEGGYVGGIREVAVLSR